MQPMVNATNRYFHQHCFKCSHCSVSLSSQDGFNMENGNLFCSVCQIIYISFVSIFMLKDCYGEMYGATCFACKQKIGANELWVEALDHNWHPQCFVCGVSISSTCNSCHLSLSILPRVVNVPWKEPASLPN